MILPDVGDFAPVGFIVTGDAFRSTKRAVVGILVTRHALGLQSEERGVAASVSAVVTVVTCNRRMGAPQRPTRLAMIETRLPATGPPDEPGIPPQMLDVTPTALFPAILAPVQTRLFPYLRGQVIVAPKASVRIEPPAGRVALAAVRIAIDFGVVTSELSGGQKLGAGRARRERPGNRSRYHQASQDRQSGDAPPHSEKIQRYP
jgi:hypothetical protein